MTSKVKSGEIKRVYEHKALGVWINEKGTYEINITKNKRKVPHMLATIKGWACGGKLGEDSNGS